VFIEAVTTVNAPPVGLKHDVAEPHPPGAVLDNWDPRVVDGIAANHRVTTFDNRSVGASTGATPRTAEEMASDAVTFIRALGLNQVGLFGLSMGGMIAQMIAQQPQLVRK
jgi:pimeloyl-ACP methyl ester carboxylesterase